MKNLLRLTIVLGMLLVAYSLVVADPGRGKTDGSAEPKRSYGAIDVIMYQTSW